MQLAAVTPLQLRLKVLTDLKTMDKLTEDHVFIGASAGVCGTIFYCCIPCVIRACGFETEGVRKGSTASQFQEPDTSSGSCFACFQSIGALGVPTCCRIIAGILGAGFGAGFATLAVWALGRPL